MTMEQEVRPGARFARDRLPWLIAAAALLLYLLTLNHWVSFTNMFQVAKVSGWTWQPALSEPLYWLITLPFRWLPLGTVPIALNLLSVVCAVLSLALLARSVALLPHDRTYEQRQKEHGEFALLSIPYAWAPPVLAVLVCGLQLTFWENATSGSVEMLNLLIFAYVIRCLLEFRIDERESWLTRAAFVYALGMTNNWAMIGFLPLFIAALIWIRGLSFFNLGFLGKMFACGLAGLLLYLLLPIVQSNSEIFTVRFWAALKANVGNQVGTVVRLYRSDRSTVALLGLTSLVPIFVIGIKWASHFGDTSKIGSALATFMFHAIHGLFLVACLWVALDPPFSPRHIGLGLHFLTFYYLGALSVGYLIGYFLLVFGAKPVRARRLPRSVTFVNTAVKFATWLLFLVAPAWLVYRNLPQIRTTNGPMFQQMGNYLTESLPAKGGIVLSDDPRRRLLAQAAMAQAGRDKSFVFVDAGSVGEHLALEYPDYHRYLRKRHGALWPADPPKTLKTFINSAAIIPLFSVLERSNSIVYLHPSFGVYFERFYLEPQGLTYQFISYKSTNALPLPLTQETVAQNEAFWSKARSEAIAPILSAMSLPQRRAKTPMEVLAQKTHLENEPNRDAMVLATFYSRALDYWGVEMQKRGELEKAASHFELALQLSSNNVAARVNLECNKNLRNHQPNPLRLTSVTESFGPFRSWNTVIGENGPFDEPNFCFEQAQMFIQGKLFRQAFQQFARAKDLEPTHLPARLWLAQLYTMMQRPDEALELIREVRQNEAFFHVNRTNVNEVMLAEASAHLAKNDPQSAKAIVDKTVKQYQSEKDLLPVIYFTAGQMFSNFKFYSNAIEMIDLHLKLAPDNVPALVNKGYVLLQTTNYAQALPPLTRALELQTNNYSALLNRAIAYLRAGQLDESQQDYLRLQQLAPKAYPVYYGLGEIAYRRKDTNSAIEFYQSYLKNMASGSPNTEEIQFVSQRLTELKQQ